MNVGWQQAIHESLSLLERGDTLFWCYPMVEELESIRSGTALDWCVELVLLAYADTAAPRDKQILDELKRLRSLALSAADAGGRAREIWYSPGLRTKSQTATSKVYESFAAYLGGNVLAYKRCVAGTITEFSLAGLTSTSDPRLHLALKAFISFLSKTSN